MELTCNHCGYTWEYGGDEPYYATCPKCLYKVKLPEENKQEEKETPEE